MTDKEIELNMTKEITSPFNQNENSEIFTVKEKPNYRTIIDFFFYLFLQASFSYLFYYLLSAIIFTDFLFDSYSKEKILMIPIIFGFFIVGGLFLSMKEKDYMSESIEKKIYIIILSSFPIGIQLFYIGFNPFSIFFFYNHINTYYTICLSYLLMIILVGFVLREQMTVITVAFIEFSVIILISILILTNYARGNQYYFLVTFSIIPNIFFSILNICSVQGNLNKKAKQYANGFYWFYSYHRGLYKFLVFSGIVFFMFIPIIHLLLRGPMAN